jgi:DNA adenine methylase Dam
MTITKTGVCPNDAARLHSNNNDAVPSKIRKTPFLWSGSKDRDWGTIRQFLPETINAYYEPFVGGGSVYFRLLAERGPITAYCTDINHDLIATYEVMRDDPEGLIRHLPPRKDKAAFNGFRKLLKSGQAIERAKRAAMFLYTNRNCLYGLGGWNAQDRYARETVIARIQYFSPLMQATTFSADGCFACPIETIEIGAFVFADPPYPGTDNRACYGMRLHDDAVMDLQKRFLDRVVSSGKSFLWITKRSEEFEEYASDYRGLKIERRDWAYRKPRQEVQHGKELYVSRPAVECGRTEHLSASGLVQFQWAA